jgi:cyclopropane-fatty-acyl-phospholipid synthase
MKDSLSRIVANRYGGRNIPVALVLPDGGRVALSEAPEVDIYARTWNGLRALASPELGRLARAYVRDDLDFSGGAQRILDIADALVGSVQHGREQVRTRVKGWWHQHRGNRPNIQHHYDVSDAFYRLWLDERMVYSCAYFHDLSDTLDQAQVQKLDHICRKLMLRPDEEFLDIGCGWGGLIFHAAQAYGAKATGITLSQNQYNYVREQIGQRGLADLVRVELLDYLELPPGKLYDKVPASACSACRHPQICALLRKNPRHPETRWAGAQSRHHVQPPGRPGPR